MALTLPERASSKTVTFDESRRHKERDHTRHRDIVPGEMLDESDLAEASRINEAGLVKKHGSCTKS